MQTCIRILLIVILHVSTICSTQSQRWDSRISGTEAFSLSGASSTLKNEFSIFNNPSTLSLNDGLNIGFAANQLYIVEGLNTISLGVSFKINDLGLGLGVERFGDQILNKFRIKIGGSHTIGGSSVGVAFTIFQDYVEGYGYSHSVGIEASSYTKLSDQIAITVIINNPILYDLRWHETSSEAMSISSGVVYSFSSNFDLYLEFQKPAQGDFNARFGASYRFQNKIYLLAGLLTNPVHQSFGIGYSKGKLAIQIGSSIHPFLGISGSASIIFSILE